MPDTGLLFVYGELGPDVTEEEFNDWYDNEHAPARLTVPGFTNAIRYKATDGVAPSWLSIYDLTTSAIVNDKPYQTLATNPTLRDRDIVPRLLRLNRRAYDLVQSLSKPDLDASTLPGKFLLLVSWLIQPELEDEFNKWYEEEHLAEIAKVPGFQRGRRYKLINSVELTHKPDPATAKPTHNYVVLYDVESDAFNQEPTFATAIQTPWTVKMIKTAKELKIRRFALHKNMERPL
ncbi:hypothetical protein BDN70DRAFT_879315 [Pholiota conissans]|uniref:Uncharacterized protein n=1 Tax=Pholiota conissans TaxID=109636 RepID=A0A9P6D0R9_9AGAR|nr:hypothetical protein BDN70DRAFT_879315 [Pholiota conissans]